jgi:beta-lactamase class A
LPVIAIALVTLYVSSVSPNGLRAVITAIPVLAIVWAGAEYGTAGFRWIRYDMPWFFLALTVGLGVMLIGYAMQNHASADRGPRRIVKQVLVMSTCAVVGWFAVLSLAASSYSGALSRLTPEQRQAMSASMTRRARWQQELGGLTKGFNGRVGVCAGDGLNEACIHGDDEFPMQSVMKLCVATAALDAVDAGRWRLDDAVVVHKQDLSVFVQPMAKLVGPAGFTTTVDDLIRRAVVDSDSAATDILIARLGGTSAVQLALNRKAILNVRVNRDEKHPQTESLGLEWRDEFLDPAALDRAVAAVPEATRDAAFAAYQRDARDTARPRQMTATLERLASGQLLSPSSTTRLLQILEQTTTFPDRLKAGVPEGWTIGHKTGTSGTWRGVTAAFNDVGILRGPKGETVSIAVFITDSKASDKDMAKLMADVARAIVTTY